MRVDQFDFELPDERIALRPATPRDSARMLVVREDGSLVHSHVRDLPDFLRSGDALVLNDTKVIAARLRGRRLGRGEVEPKIEILLHRRIGSDAFLAFSRPARKLMAHDRLMLGQSLAAEILSKGDGGEVTVKFDRRRDAVAALHRGQACH